MKATIVLTLVSLVLAACGQNYPKIPGETRVCLYGTDSPDPAQIEVEGIYMEVLPPVKDRLSALAINGSEDGSMRINLRLNMDLVSEEEPTVPGSWLWLGGHELYVRDGSLWIGDSVFGSVAKGDEVRIDAEGVHINGEHRGVLPGG